MAKNLIIYYSLKGETIAPGMKIVNLEKGHTAVAAEFIRKAVGGDLFEIETAKTYIKDHMKMIYEAKEELEKGIRPELKGFPENWNQYDTIFLGYPNWWGDWPMICYTYFEANDFSGKMLVPFSTHAGSGLSGFDRKLESAAPGAKVLTGLAVAGTDAQNHQDTIRGTVSDWISGLGF